VIFFTNQSAVRDSDYCCATACIVVAWLHKSIELFVPNVSSVPTQLAAVFMQEVDTPADYRTTFADSTQIILFLKC